MPLPHLLSRVVVGLCAGCIAASVSAGEPTVAVSHEAFVGAWWGTVKAPNASTEIGFVFTRSPNGLRVSLTMPAMSLFAADLGPAHFEGDEFVLAPLDTKLRTRADKLVGSFAIPGLPTELSRVEALPPRPAADRFPPGPSPLWSAGLRATIWGSPFVAGQTVYVGTTDGAFHARAVRDGKEVWTWRGPHPIYGTALVTENEVTFVDDAWNVVCLSRNGGEVLWRRALADAATQQATRSSNETFNHRTPRPVLAGGLLYVGSADGFLHALGPSDGTVRWRHPVGAPIYATVGAQDGLLLCGGMDGTVLVLDAERNERARVKLPRAVVSTPVMAGGVIVTGCRDYMLYGLKATDLTVAWRHSFWFSWVESTPALVDGLMYIGGSDYARITAFEPATGQVQWQTNVHGLTWGTPLVTADTVYAGTHAQRGALIPHEGSIIALDRKTGKVRWRVPLVGSDGAERSGVLGSLALAGDRIVAATFDGELRAYPCSALVSTPIGSPAALH